MRDVARVLDRVVGERGARGRRQPDRAGRSVPEAEGVVGMGVRDDDRVRALLVDSVQPVEPRVDHHPPPPVLDQE